MSATNISSDKLGFQAINSFVQDLSLVYGKKHKSLKLYQRLISQTPFEQTEFVQKHINIYKKFCKDNKEAILNKDSSKIVSPLLSYSQRIYIDMSIIFNLANKDPDSAAIVWQHLLVISAIFDSEIAGKLAEQVKLVKDTTNSKEDALIANIVSEVEKNVKPDSNPSEVVMTLMQSDSMKQILTSMQSGAESGNLNIGKMISAVTKIVPKISDGDDEKTKQAMQILENVGKMFDGNGNNGPPDLSSLLGMMSGLMGGTDMLSGLKQLGVSPK